MTRRILLAAISALLITACSGNPSVQTGALPANEVNAIAVLLHQGERKDAKKRVKAALKQDPTNPSLMLLKQAIDGDAREDLGPQSFPYTVQPGDTMAKLAQRFLGNWLKAYQLAQYNDIDTPDALQSGIVLRIPGQPPRAPSPTPSASRSPKAPAATPASPQPRSSSPAPVTNADVAAAKRAHAAGLAALNRGKVNDAVAQLRRATTLDPGNAAIGRDLARAERIAATVRSRQ